jgi:uncharacterized protein
MLTPLLESLLVLQDRDSKRLDLEAQLKAVPLEIGRVEATIAAERAAIEEAKTELRSLETQKKGIETEIGSAEDQLGKYKTQQLGVRKNDEYQALGHEIETVQGRIGDLEGRELGVMYAIDEARKKFAAADAVLRQNIAGHEARIAMLREREANLKAQHQEATAAVTAARVPVAPAVISIYDSMAVRGMPVVVRIVAGKCGGCHLRISSEVESAARGKGAPGELARCDQCARIVYWDS